MLQHPFYEFFLFVKKVGTTWKMLKDEINNANILTLPNGEYYCMSPEPGQFYRIQPDPADLDTTVDLSVTHAGTSVIYNGEVVSHIAQHPMFRHSDNKLYVVDDQRKPHLVLPEPKTTAEIKEILKSVKLVGDNPEDMDICIGSSSFSSISSSGMSMDSKSLGALMEYLDEEELRKLS